MCGVCVGVCVWGVCGGCVWACVCVCVCVCVVGLPAIRYYVSFWGALILYKQLLGNYCTDGYLKRPSLIGHDAHTLTSLARPPRP